MRLIFMGTPDFAATALHALIDAGHQICAVYSQPPRPAGRGQRPQPSAVQALAEAQGLKVLTPRTFKDAAARADFAAHEADAAVVAAYGLLLPSDVLAAPTHGCINIHASLLPRWRGAAPIHRAIEAGDPETGISLMQMQRGLDTGPVLKARKLKIGALDTTASLQSKLARLGGETLVEALPQLAALAAVPQPSAGVTYAAKIDKGETQIDWSQPPETIARKIRAFSPFPGAWFAVAGERIKVLNARASAGGALNLKGVELLELQRAGKRAQPVEAFLAGFDVTKLQQFQRSI